MKRRPAQTAATFRRPSQNREKSNPARRARQQQMQCRSSARHAHRRRESPLPITSVVSQRKSTAVLGAPAPLLDNLRRRRTSSSAPWPIEARARRGVSTTWPSCESAACATAVLCTEPFLKLGGTQAQVLRRARSAAHHHSASARRHRPRASRGPRAAWRCRSCSSSCRSTMK